MEIQTETRTMSSREFNGSSQAGSIPNLPHRVRLGLPHQAALEEVVDLDHQLVGLLCLDLVSNLRIYFTVNRSKDLLGVCYLRARIESSPVAICLDLILSLDVSLVDPES